MAKNAFIDPVTRRLKCYGYVESNTVGDEKIVVLDNFDLDPSVGWSWNGTTFVSSPLPTPPNVLAAVRSAHTALMADATVPDTVKAWVVAMKTLTGN